MSPTTADIVDVVVFAAACVRSLDLFVVELRLLRPRRPITQSTTNELCCRR